MAFPASDLENAPLLLDSLGTFWSAHAQRDSLEVLLETQGALHQSLVRDLQEWRDSWSIYGLSLSREYFMEKVTLSEAARGRYAVRYGDGYEFGESTFFFGGSETDFPAWEVSNWVSCASIMSEDFSIVLVEGVDFFIDKELGLLVFNEDPFHDNAFSSYVSDTEERTVTLWASRLRTIYAPSRRMVSRLFGCLIPQDAEGSSLLDYMHYLSLGGPTWLPTLRALASCWGVTVPDGGEIVQSISTYNERLLIVTDRAVHARHADAVPLVEVGDTLTLGQNIADDFQWWRNRGQTTPEWLTYLDVPDGILLDGLDGDFRFSDASVPLVVTEEDDRTRVSWALDGSTGDEEEFWDLVHSRGIAQGTPLAQFLDVREDAEDDPTEHSLPDTVNPLAFLLQNLLRCGVTFLRLRKECRLSTPRLYDSTPVLASLLPSHALLWVLVEDDDSQRWQALNRFPTNAEVWEG